MVEDEKPPITEDPQTRVRGQNSECPNCPTVATVCLCTWTPRAGVRRYVEGLLTSRQPRDRRWRVHMGMNNAE